MEQSVSPTLSSFIIRFVVEAGSQTLRGEIRHIQSGEELQFTDWEDAVEFMRRYVPLTGSPPSGDDQRKEIPS